jgi:hypothetical protein
MAANGAHHTIRNLLAEIDPTPGRPGILQSRPVTAA